ncbi:uncharacterized protein [Amphiura filiformis]|uniref:uncharacterized protein n=1 Tax=Amphiura filiformis TaxID=82378 RepID=UPI003B228450
MKSSATNRVYMWTMPRTTSTAVLKCLTKVPNSLIWCEPHVWGNYFAPDAHLTDFKQWFKESWGVDEKDIEAVTGGYLASSHSYQWIKEQMESTPPNVDLIFVKDHPGFGFTGQDYALIPKGFQHTFLIRHPYKVFDSWKRMINRGVVDATKRMKLTDQPHHLLPKGYHFQEQYEMYQHVKQHIDANPVILDVDDLLNDPATYLKAYCEAVNIPYSEELLHWEAGRECMDSQWMVPKEALMADYRGGTNRETFESTGFLKPKPCPQRVDLDDDVLHCSDTSMKYYKEMYEKRLKA